MYFYYKDYLKKFSQINRKVPTKAEGLFWNVIVKGDRTGYRFLRQKPIAGYILDFHILLQKYISYFHIILQKYLPFLIEGCVVPKTNEGFDWETMIEEYVVANIIIPHYLSDLFGWHIILS